MKALSLFFALLATASADPRPNILWITSEDNSPDLGCYGDPQADTPNIDELANKGVRYRNATSNAPVCSTARTTLVTGMYPTSLGAENHRSKIRIPENFKLYPELLRAAGHYCTNNFKTDYNLLRPGKIWDESSKEAHYKNRPEGAPFFAIFNLTTTHKGKVAPKEDKTDFRVEPERVFLPPYHPETPEDAIRRDWANYYDLMTEMDKQVGDLIEELDDAGLKDDTIVFYFSDHGGPLPRGKRNIHDSGTRVPLVIHIPAKFSGLSPAAFGEWIDDPVSFVDFPATLLNLCGIPVPENYQGRPFLGKKLPDPRKHTFLYRGRMDERYDTVRSIRDRETQYIRNYSPHRSWGQQHCSYAFQVLPSMRAWYDAFRTADLVPEQARYWQEKPGEELYRFYGDPFQIKNLIGDSGEQGKIEEMRKTLDAEILAFRDAGFIPEGMATRLAGEKTIFGYARSDSYPLEKILAAQNAIDHMAKEENIPLAKAKEVLLPRKWEEPLQRIPAYVATLEPDTREPKILEPENR